MKKIASNKKYMVNPILIIQILITLILLIIVLQMYNKEYGVTGIKYVSLISVTMLINQLFFLFKSEKKFSSFEFWFIALSYLFMFGQIFLYGLFNIQQIEALGYVRDVLDNRYSIQIIYKSSLFILICIQMMFLGFIFVKKEKNDFKEEKDNNKLFTVSKILLLFGFPCHLIYSGRMIMLAQMGKSYDSIVDYSGLIDDFSNLMIYGIVCMFFSKRIKRSTARTLLLICIIYLLIIMMLTGDRRYQFVSIIVLVLSYFKAYNIKIDFTIKWLFAGIFGYLLLGLLYLVREIRTDNIMSFFDFIDSYKAMIFSGKTNFIVQTLYEFGGSLYTVCLAQKYIPFTIGYKYGKTLLTGLISIIPTGFLYNNSVFFQDGRVALALMNLGKTTVGSSFYADLYANFGFVGGIIFALVFGFLLCKLFNKSSNNDVLYSNARYYILFYALLHLVRASFTEVIRTGMWGFIIITVLYNMKWRKKHEEDK